MCVTLFVLQATDGDKPGTENSSITYSLTRFTEYFQINANTGNITVKKQLDYENLISPGQKGVINLTVVAHDQGHQPLSATADVFITLLVRIVIFWLFSVLIIFAVAIHIDNYYSSIELLIFSFLEFFLPIPYLDTL